jgi:hypothetical protein
VQSARLVAKAGEFLTQAWKTPVKKADASSPKEKGKHSRPLPDAAGQSTKERPRIGGSRTVGIRRSYRWPEAIVDGVASPQAQENDDRNDGGTRPVCEVAKRAEGCPGLAPLLNSRWRRRDHQPARAEHGVPLYRSHHRMSIHGSRAGAGSGAGPARGQGSTTRLRSFKGPGIRRTLGSAARPRAAASGQTQPGQSAA